MQHAHALNDSPAVPTAMHVGVIPGDDGEGMQLESTEQPHPGFGASPRRLLMRKKAYERMVQAGARMSEKAAKKDGVGMVLPVGMVVAISIADVDRAKMDSTTATLVVVEVVHCGEVRAEPKYRLACKDGVLKSLRTRSYVKPLPGVNAEMMGLADALANWKSMPTVSERACSRLLSAVGGQGVVHCLCTGKCDNNKCSCFKAGRECNSRCHKNNAHCCNKML